jgi:PAS domain S-box-containing protein
VEVTAMTSELRKTGISIVGDIPWGTHFCYFYETKQDLLDILVPYFKVGLENNEFCLWVISNSELLTMQEATSALRKALPDLDGYLAERRIEVVAHDEWFLNGGAFDLHRVANRFKEKLDEALARGYAGMRVNGSPAWLQKKDGKELREFEEEVDKLFFHERIIASCTYPVGESRAEFLLDVARNHQFAIARRQGNWDVLETPELMQAKQEIKRLNEELEQRVIERTGELAAANEELRKEISERKQVEEQHKQSERQLAEAQHMAHVGSWNWDLQSNALSWSDELYRIFGVDTQAFNPAYEEFVVEFVHAEDQALVRGIIESSLKTQEPFSFYNRILRPNGEERVIHTRGNVVGDEHGNPIRMFGTAQDVTERKRAEEALKDSQRRLEVAQRIAHVGHYEHNLDTGVIVMSDENYRILGIQPQESITLSRAFEFMHPEDRARVHQVRNEAVRMGQQFNVEYRIVRPDGEVRYIHSHGDVIRDEQGRARRTFGIAQDITERKQAEALLHARGQEFRAFVENTPDQVIKYDREFRRAYVNPAVAKAYDLPVEALIGKPFGSVIQDAGLDVKAGQLAQIRQRIAAVFDTGESSVYEITWPLPTGRRYYSVRFFPEFDLNGVVIYVWGISRDITELKETQHQILALTENSPDLIARFDRDGRYLYLNSAVEKLIGIPVQELRSKRIGETLSDHVYPAVPNDVLSLRGAIDKVFASGSAIETEIQVPLPAGERNFNVRLIPERDEAGQVSSVLHIGRDITERKRAGEMLQTFPRRLIEVQEAERRRVARELHDEIGQALTAIKLNLQAVEQSADTSPHAPHLNESVGIIDRALQQVRDLSFDLRPSLLDDLGLVAALRWYVDREARRGDLIPEFVADLSETRLPPELETACFRITQEALTNVVRHAQARRVWVELRQRGSELHLVVRDDGIGFDVSAVRRRHASDVSLGLEGMQERALILNGKIEIKSAPAHGTEIHVWFSLTVIPSSANEEGGGAP